MTRTTESDLRQKILDTARHLLAAEGYTHLTMRKIAGAIGYSATSIYLHFENKDQLVHELIDEGVSHLYDRLRLSIDHLKGDPVERLRTLCETYIAFGLDNPEYYEIMYISHPEYQTRYPAEKYRKARRNLELISDTLKDGVEASVFEPIDPYVGASIVWTKMHGVVSLLISKRLDARIEISPFLKEAVGRIISSFRRSVHSTDTAI